MARIDIAADRLTITLTGIHRVLGRWNDMHVDIAHITDVKPGDRYATRRPMVRWGHASSIPGLLHTGSFLHNGRREFWDVRDSQRAIIIELTGHKYARLVLQVDDPQRTIACINAVRMAV
jgi:hypothetical protein